MIYKAAKALASEVLAVHCISMFFWFSGLGEGLLPRRAIFDFCRHLCELLKVKERVVLNEIHPRTTGRHLSVGSHSVICHPTEGRLVLDLSTP